MEKPGVVLVTGASRGLGTAITECFVRSGFHVVGVARSRDFLGPLRDEFGDRVTAWSCDVRSVPEVKRIAELVESRWGYLDVLVLNAGVGYVEPLETMKLEHWKETIDVNLTAAFTVTRACLPLLRKSGRPHIFAVNSVAARRGFAGWGAYCASKHGLLGFTDALREELRDKGIKVTSIVSGAVQTSFWDRVDTGFDRSRMIEPASIAELLLQTYRQATDAVTEEIVIKPAGGDF